MIKSYWEWRRLTESLDNLDIDDLFNDEEDINPEIESLYRILESDYRKADRHGLVNPVWELIARIDTYDDIWLNVQNPTDQHNSEVWRKEYDRRRNAGEDPFNNPNQPAGLRSGPTGAQEFSDKLREVISGDQGAISEAILMLEEWGRVKEFKGDQAVLFMWKLLLSLKEKRIGIEDIAIEYYATDITDHGPDRPELTEDEIQKLMSVNSIDFSDADEEDIEILDNMGITLVKVKDWIVADQGMYSGENLYALIISKKIN